MKSTIEFFAAISACCMLASQVQAATIQSFGIAPSNPLPGDLVTAFFQVDGSIPVGAAGVWIDGIEQCQAFAEHEFFSCTFSVPHGGRFNYELRFHDTNGVLTTSTQQALSGALRIVKFQPEIVQAGRSSVIFAKLDYFHPAASPQPQGQIEIVSLDGAQRCTIQLPQQTHCQILFSQAGRYPLRAQYSGDANYPALTSAVSEILVANPKLDHVIYANEAPLGPIVADATLQPTSFPAKFNAYGNWLLMPQRGAIDYNVGAQIPLFNNNPYIPAFVGASRIFGSPSTGIYAMATPRGEQHAPFSASGSVHSVDPKGRILIQTDESLVASDNNQSSDWYLKTQASNAIEWLSKKADSSAISSGVPNAVFNSEAIAFSSDENNIVSGDQDGLPDTFIARAGFPTIRLPLSTSRTEAPFPMRLNAASDKLLCYTNLALTADDLDTQPDFYVFSANSLEYRRILGAQFEDSAYFSPDDAVVFFDGNTNTLIVQPLVGPRRSFVLSSLAIAFRLTGTTSAGQALFFGGPNGSLRLLVDLNTGVEQIRAGRVMSDEALLRTPNLSLNYSGSSVLTAPASGLLTLNADGTGRNAMAATQVQSIRMDDDARYRAFSSFAALIPEDTNNALDVYEWDQTATQLSRLSRRVDGTQTTRATELLAYSRSEGIALVMLDGADFPIPNTGLNIGRINLATGIVTPTPNLGTSASRVLGNSRNGRWVVLSGTTGAKRVETQSGATTMLADLYQPGLESLTNIAISDNGQNILASVQMSSRTEVRLLNLATNTVQTVFQTTDGDVVVKISAAGRHALIGSRIIVITGFISPPPPPLPRKLFLLDLERGLITEQIAGVQNNSFDFSGDASTLAWTSFVGSFGQNGGVTIRENPYYKQPTYTSIVRTVPSLPNLTQDFLVEAVVSHKESGLAPSGIVRFDDGNGAQCDGELIAQGELAIARCRILPNAHGLYTRLLSSPASNTPLALSLTASYLGDRRYGASQTSRNVTVNKLTPTIRWLVANPSTVPEVSVGIEVDALAGAAFTGSARITSNLGIPCFLSAVEILAAKRCRFFIPYADSFAFNVTLNDPIYTLGTGTSMYLNVGTPDALFVDGFE